MYFNEKSRNGQKWPKMDIEILFSFALYSRNYCLLYIFPLSLLQNGFLTLKIDLIFKRACSEIEGQPYLKNCQFKLNLVPRINMVDPDHFGQCCFFSWSLTVNEMSCFLSEIPFMLHFVTSTKHVSWSITLQSTVQLQLHIVRFFLRAVFFLK